MQGLTRRLPSLAQSHSPSAALLFDDKTGNDPWKKCKEQGGFTLAEVLVTLSISVIVIAIAATFIIFGMNFLSRTEMNASDKQFAEGSSDFIKKRLLFARSIEVVRADKPPSTVEGDELLFIGRVDPATGKVVIANEGSLYYMLAGEDAPVEIISEESYSGSSLALDFRAIVDKDGTMRTSKTFEITAKTIRKEQVTYTSKKTFNLYGASYSSKAEPRTSISIDSWHDAGFGQSESDQLYYLLINPDDLSGDS
jgi:prepilin-type N-terminal cleavage/methylation domain-containing protein